MRAVILQKRLVSGLNAPRVGQKVPKSVTFEQKRCPKRVRKDKNVPDPVSWQPEWTPSAKCEIAPLLHRFAPISHIVAFSPTIGSQRLKVDLSAQK